MDRNTLTKRQVFYIAEFNEEAAWLSLMHREGWKMTETTGFKYTFEACPEEDWVYQLDFRDKNVEEEEYIQMFADYGWEFVTRFRHWYYFRKIRTAGDDMSIFSDNESKIDMCKRVVGHHVILLTGLYLLILAIFAFLNSGAFFVTDGGFLDGFLDGAIIGCAIGGILGIFLAGNQIHRLRRKIRQMENPL